MVTDALPRDINIKASHHPVTRIYTDASFEEGELRLGCVIFHPDYPTLGGTCLVPQSTLDSWNPRRQQIYPGESLAALVTPVLYPQYFRGGDVIWFVDSQAAVSSLIRATSTQLDVHAICQFAHLVAFRLHSRIWYEWIDSPSNPRSANPWTQRQGRCLHEHPFPRDLFPERFLSSDSFVSLILNAIVALPVGPLFTP